MRKTISILMLGIAVMLASCSRDEDRLQTGGNGETTRVTFTARVEGGMNLRSAKTRSVTDPTDEAISRPGLEIYNRQSALAGDRIIGSISGDNITFTAQLEEGATYTCLFWADGGTEAYDITNLEAIACGANPSIAYYAKKQITASATPEDVTLTHAVSKVVLHETGTLAAGDKVGVSFTLPGYTFNVTDCSCAGGADEAIGKVFDITPETTTGQVGWLYVFAPAAGADLATVTLSYTASGGSEKTAQVSNVPLKPNHRTVLKGEFAKIGTLAQGFNAALDTNWEGNYLDKLITTAAGDITANPTLIKQALNADGTLVIEGPVNTVDIYAVVQWTRDNPGMLKSLDLSGTTGLTEIERETFVRNDVITSVILPASLQTIGDRAFELSGLVEIEIPNSVTSIGKNCFYGCAALASVTLPEGITSIKGGTFSGCTTLKKITIPTAVETIEYYALYLPELESLVFEGIMAVTSSFLDEPDRVTGSLVLNNSIMGNSSQRVTGFNVFLPNITDRDIAASYKVFFTTEDVYYNYTGGANGDKTDSANYTKYE